MKNEEVDLNDIKPIEHKYSKISKNIDKIFKEKSLEYFQKHQKHKKQHFVNANFELAEVESKFKKKIKYDPSQFDFTHLPLLGIHQKKTVEKEKFTEDEQYYKDRKDETRRKKFQYLVNMRKKMPDFGRYYPNYKAISKKVQNIIFYPESTYKPILHTEPRPSSRSKSPNKLETEPAIKLQTESNVETNAILSTAGVETTANQQEAIHMTISQNSKVKSRIPIESPRQNKVHGISFDRYSHRKNEFMTVNNSNSEIISYIEPSNYIENLKKKNLVVYRRPHNDTQKKNQKMHDNVPSICYYNPKYNLVSKKVLGVVPYSHRVPMSPKRKVQKIWRSYKVGVDYQLVNFKPFTKQ